MQATTRSRGSVWAAWRIVLALAGKDIVDAIRNKTTLTMVLGVGLMVLTVQALPLLLKLDKRPRVAIYDAARSGVADELRRDGSLQVLEMRSAQDAIDTALAASGPLVAVTLPDDWESGQGTLAIEGYAAHAVSARSLARLTAAAETALAVATGRSVTIDVGTLYPTLASRGHTIMVGLGLVLAVLLITSILVPHLILEEKTAHTLDVLRISPASTAQVMLGKGLAGVVYGLLAAALLLAPNLAMVNLWGVMLAAVLVTTLLGVGLGLLVGAFVENEGMAQMWLGLLVLALMFPLLLLSANSGRLPQWATLARNWFPTVAAFDLVRLSFGEHVVAAQFWPRLGAVVLADVLVFAAAGWRLGRVDSGARPRA